MRPAPVGFQCPDCVASGRAQVAPSLARAQRARLRRNVSDIPVTSTLMAINLIVWLAIMATGGASSRLADALTIQGRGLCDIDDRSLIGLNAAQCLARGGSYFPGVADGAYWQLLTNAFTHVSVLHIGVNMLSLWFIGPALEIILGRARYLTLYVLSALAGSVAVLWLSNPNVSTLGASGAIFGLMGALLTITWKRGGDMRNVLSWIGINVAFTFVGGAHISWQGHLGGLVGGIVIAWVLTRERGRPTSKTWFACLVMAVVLVAAAVVRAVMLR